MVKQPAAQVLLRVPSTRVRNKSHAIDADRKHTCCPGLKVVGAAARKPSAALADAPLRCKRVPAVPTTPKGAGGWNAPWQPRRGSSGVTPDEDSREAREHLRHSPPDKKRGNSIEHRSHSAGPSRHAQHPASDKVTVGLPRMHSSPQAVPSVHENGLTGDDLLLLCGVKPGSSKALWYTTMRAQLEARALAMRAEKSDRGDSATSNRPRTGVGSSSLSSHSPMHRAEASPEPLVLPTALLLLAEPSDLNARTMGASKSAAQPIGKIPRTRSGEDEAEKVEADDGASSLGTRSTSLCSEKVANTSVMQAAPNAAPLVPLKRLRLSPKQLTQMRVSVLSLQALVDL
ncbi:conserved hypothetical protein [Leishmania major strain Friedlin]|uniref:Uncharacterized protein n=1 Tax=Leishmania major TaxID=5664 RepID=Q4Q2R8_LEIMA|nr:conserved hypothetical protein [Leishmania major strain Friedlin]CAG9582154.1 hypothetical_protein_-_conserved [Leishmania major strain Friedlin]CAJ07997.1 conserved hypothetical protein [Leishmania major strain Friedlin]|eukprot:XP_001686380.1 conserved hypothetical protein [Leishmania major strain Friedlin]